MQNFNLGALSEWERIIAGEVIGLDVPAAGFRRVEMDVLTDAPVGVFVTVQGAGEYLVGAGEGLLSFAFTVGGGAAFHVDGHADTTIMLRTKARSQEMPESDEPSYTSIEPRPSGPSDEVRRMMRLMNLNHERRMAELRQEIASLRPAQAVERVAEVIEREEAPARDPDPVPGPAEVKA